MSASCSTCNQPNCCCEPCPPCNPALDETCEPFEVTTSAKRVIVEDEASCKRTIAAPENNSILLYDASSNVIAWRDGSDGDPIRLPNLQNQEGDSVPSVIGQQSDGDLVALEGTAAAAEPEVLLHDGTDWDVTERSAMFGAGTGALVRDLTANPGIAAWRTGTVGQVLAIDASGDARFTTASGIVTSASIDGSGLIIDYVNNDQISVTCGFLVLQSATSAKIQLSNISVNINRTVSGAGGVDTGAIAASTFYWVYVIYNPTTVTTSAVVSLNATSPTLPAGYTYYRKVGAFATGSGGATWNGSIHQNGNIWNSSAGGSYSYAGTARSVMTITSATSLLQLMTPCVPNNMIKEAHYHATFLAATSGTTTGYAQLVTTTSTFLPSSGNPVEGMYATVAQANQAVISRNLRVFVSPLYQYVQGLVYATAIGGAGSAISITETGYTWNFV